MKKYSLTATLLAGTFLTGSLLTPDSLAEGKHVHGEADIYIAIQGSQVIIDLESPADNIIGYEHAPKTKAQEAKLEASLKTLSNYQSLISFNNGKCTQLTANVKSPFADDHDHHEDDHKKHEHDHHKEHDKHEDHGHGKHGSHHDEHHAKHKGHDDHKEHDHHKEHKHHDDHDDHHGEDTHSEFHTSYTLECKINGSPSVDVSAFSNFKNLEKITLYWVTDNKQGSLSVTAKTAKGLSIK